MDGVEGRETLPHICSEKGGKHKDNISENPTAFANVKVFYLFLSFLFFLLRHQISMNIIIWNVMCRPKRY